MTHCKTKLGKFFLIDWPRPSSSVPCLTKKNDSDFQLVLRTICLTTPRLLDMWKMHPFFFKIFSYIVDENLFPWTLYFWISHFGFGSTCKEAVISVFADLLFLLMDFFSSQFRLSLVINSSLSTVHCSIFLFRPPRKPNSFMVINDNRATV